MYDITSFDFVWGCAIDIFHLAYEGITKLMLMRTFVLRSTKEAREMLAEISFMYMGTRVFTETARKGRKLQVKMLKGNELGVLILSIFPVIAYRVIEGNTNYWSVTGQMCERYSGISMFLMW